MVSSATLQRPDAMPARSGRSVHRRDIQGLRAIAVALVVLDHLLGWPAGGFVGVDVFFVISGFLITSLMLREHERTGRISLRNFYVRRVRRLFPAAFVCLAAIGLGSLYLFHRSRALDSLLDVGWAYGFLANWRFAIKGTDYLQEDLAPSPVQHYWSLAVEEQFYLIWPLLLIAALSLAVGCRWFGGRESRAPLAVLLAALSLVSFAWAVYETRTNPTVSYFSSLSRAWELGAGAFLAVTAHRVLLPFPARAALAWAGVLTIGLSAVTISAASSFPGPAALGPVVGTAAVVLSGVSGRPTSLFLLCNPVSDYLGKISYSLYLWHWPVLVFLGPRLSLDGLTQFLLLLAIAVALASLSFYLIEEPVRRASGWGYDLRFPGVTRGLRVTPAAVRGACAFLVTAAVVAAVPGVWQTLDPERPTVASTPPSGARALIGGGGAQPTAEEQAFVPIVDEIEDDLPEVYSKGCHQFQDGVNAAPCVFDHSGGRADALEVALVGDSHAVHWVPALREVAEQEGWVLSTYTKSACPLADVMLAYPVPARYEACATWNARVQDAVGAERPDLLLVAASRTYSNVFEEKDGGGELVQGPEARELVRHGFVRSWAAVKERGVEVVVLDDTPRPGTDVVECLHLHRDGPGECAVPRADALGPESVLAEAAQEAPGVPVVNLNQYICPGERCELVIGGVVVYRDSNHLTATYSRTLAPMLRRELGSVLEDGR